MARSRRHNRKGPSTGRSKAGRRTVLIVLLVGAAILIDLLIYFSWKRTPPRQPVETSRVEESRVAAPTNLVVAPPSAPVVPPPAELVVATQVALDRLWFSPGMIDGKIGSQTRAAIAAWQQANDLPQTGEIEAVAAKITGAPEVSYVNYVVTADDFSELGKAPEDWLERSQQPRMAYETILELVAEKFHCKEAFVRSLNPRIVDWSALQAGASIAVPDPRDDNRAKPRKASRLRVSLSAKFVRAFDENGMVIAHFPCSIAAREEKRPVGILTVQSIAPRPNYTFDPANFPDLDLLQKAYGKLIIPPGPNNPVGTAWIGLNQPGYGIHGTPHPEQIGRTESLGCFRLANWNAERLMQMISVGTPVEIVRD